MSEEKVVGSKDLQSYIKRSIEKIPVKIHIPIYVYKILQKRYGKSFVNKALQTLIERNTGFCPTCGAKLADDHVFPMYETSREMLTKENSAHMIRPVEPVFSSEAKMERTMKTLTEHAIRRFKKSMDDMEKRNRELKRELMEDQKKITQEFIAEIRSTKVRVYSDIRKTVEECFIEAVRKSRKKGQLRAAEDRKNERRAMREQETTQ